MYLLASGIILTTVKVTSKTVKTEISKRTISLAVNIVLAALRTIYFF
jgi:hypothetical protein